MPTWLKWLLGCAIGFFALVMLCCLGTCFGGKALFGDILNKVRKAEADSGLARAASERVAALDLDFPPALPEDAGAAEITDADVERYLRVRRAIQPQAEAFQKLEDAAVSTPAGPLGFARGMVGLVGAAAESHGLRRALLESAEPALRAESMGPTDLTRLAEIVEWRFLRREEARFLGLPAASRHEFQQLRLEERLMTAWTSGSLPPGMRVNDRSIEQTKADLENVRQRLARLAAEADGRTGLTASTLAALEARRADLLALSSAGLQAMAPLTAEPPFTSFLDNSHGFSGGYSGEWSTRGGSGKAGESGAPATEASAEAPVPEPAEPAPAGESGAP